MNTKSTRTYQRPAWLTLLAIAMVVVPLIVYAVMLANGYGAFDGRGILALIFVVSGMAILGSGKGEARG